MILGVIADDFTGAGDAALVLSDAGMETALLPRIPDVPACGADAGVVALKTRSVEPDRAVSQSLEALEALRAAGCRQILFKYCSTFDSTPRGNIGPVAEALARALGVTGVVVCPAFPANGRTLFQGNLFVGDVPLAESGMRHHPVTPMTDSDLRRWLRRQCTGPVGHVPLQTVRRGADAVCGALAAEPGLAVVDAVEDADLLTIGRALRDAPLVTGGSAVAQGLPANFRQAGLIGAPRRAWPVNRGDALVLAGSCSEATNAQVARYREGAPALALDVARLVAGDPVLEEAQAFAARHRAEAPLIHSTVAPDRLTRDGAAAGAVETVLAALAANAAARGVTRLVVAGGETSGAVVQALDTGPLGVGPAIAPGVPALRAGELSLALKSGNFGGTDFFAHALAVLGGAP